MSKLLVKVNDRVLADFDNGQTEYRYPMPENADAVPTVSAMIQTVDSSGRIQETPVDVIQAVRLPDCALFEASGKTYRIRFVREGSWMDISTDIYDAFAADPNRAAPEFPFFRDYTGTCVMKLFLALPDRENGSSQVNMNFDEALDAIRQLDAVTAGVPKIIYLVGWQFHGHDDRYPNWDVVNPYLKCRHLQNEDASESLIWLMDEALKYNTSVSLHINSSDAFENAPDWELYIKNDLIRKQDGELFKYAIFSGEQAYRINHYNEWKSGFYKARVDKLCTMLKGRLERAGSIHSDAFMCFDSDATSLIEDIGGRCAMIRYWHSKGIDMTSEFSYSFREGAQTDAEYTWKGVCAECTETTLGLTPAVWHLIQPPEYYLKRPAGVLTGCNVPDSKAAFLFGSSNGAESIVNVGDDGNGLQEGWDAEMTKEFCTTSAVAFYLYRFQRLALENNGETAVYAEGLIADYPSQTIRRNDVVIRDHNNICVPMSWESDSVLIYSEEGCNERIWKLDEGWMPVCDAADVFENTVNGRRYLTTAAIIDNTVTLQVNAGQMLILKPRKG